MKQILLSLALLFPFPLVSEAANTILLGTDPIEETGGPDGWDGVVVMTTPIEGPPGETVGILSTFNFYADPGRIDPVGLLTPLIIKESGGTYTIETVGKQIEVTEGGIQSVPIEVVEGSEVIDLSGGDNFHIAVAQERVDGTNNTDGGVIPFAAEGGKGIFYFDSEPPFVPVVGEEVSSGHESTEGGRLYQFNFEVIFSDDDPNAVLPRNVDLGQLPSFPEIQDFSINVRNSGQANPLTLTSVEVTGGPQASNFSVVDFVGAVPGGGEGKINLQLDSKGETGLFKATVEVKSNDETPEDQVISFEVSASVLNLAGPASRLTLDEEAGASELLDITGFNRHGVVNPFDGVATLGESGLKPETGSAMKVSNGGGAAIPGSAFESFEEFAISLWINAAELGSSADARFGTVAGLGTQSPLFGLLLADGEVIWFGESDGVAGPIFQSDSTPIKLDTVHHLVMTRSPGRASIWVDGVEVAGADNPPAIGETSDSTLYIGGFNGALGFTGVIDDVQIYDRVLAAEDIEFLNSNPGLTLGETGAPADSDGDGLDDQREAELGTDPLVADSDGDGLSDGAEVDTHKTNPLSLDTDDDKFGDALEIAEGHDPLDPNSPGGLPPVRSGDPNDPLEMRASVDGWSSLMVIDESSPFDFASVGTTSGIVNNFQFWVGAATGRVTPFIAEPAGENEYIVRYIGTTRVSGEDYDSDDEATAVSFPFDDNNSAITVQQGWVSGFTVANPDGSENEGAVIPFDGGGGDMWLAGGPAPEQSASLTVGEAPNTEASDAQFTTNSLGRIYAFSITATGDIDGGGGIVDPPVNAPQITGISKTAAGVALQLPDGTTYDIEYSEDLQIWILIATDVTGSHTDDDAVRVGSASGYYRGVVK